MVIPRMRGNRAISHSPLWNGNRHVPQSLRAAMPHDIQGRLPFHFTKNHRERFEIHGRGARPSPVVDTVSHKAILQASGGVWDG